MAMGSPTSPHSGHQSQFLPGYLLGDSMSHSPSLSVTRLWSASGHSPQKSARLSGISPSKSGSAGTPRLESGVRGGKDKGRAPPIKGIFHSVSPSSTQPSFVTPTQAHSRTPGLHSTSAPPTAGLGSSCLFTPERGFTSINASHVVSSPTQLDPFYTQGEMLTAEDVLDETWVTVFGFPPAAASYILQQFSQYGNILKKVIATEGNWMHIHYQSKIQAKKALSKNGKILGGSIMIGVTACIDKKAMEEDKENGINISISTPNTSRLTSTQGSISKGSTPIRPLTAAYKAARSESEVVKGAQAPQKSNGFISKTFEYVFGW
ncbi:hypothetical protein CHS0354_040903 [Potamilus streckersoni]|uniref:Nucleoporin NUP53 n=1 Tax=Potamilus streckersoni TaxID=2493646 RepID=A0AAE0SLL3_9BIVA|nr:hypothetical protein CHS0354_040903 [Potamilus streckersoni]